MEALLPQFGVRSGTSDPLDHLATMLDSMADSRLDPATPVPPSPGEILPLAVPGIPPALRAFIAKLEGKG